MGAEEESSVGVGNNGGACNNTLDPPIQKVPISQYSSLLIVVLFSVLSFSER